MRLYPLLTLVLPLLTACVMTAPSHVAQKYCSLTVKGGVEAEREIKKILASDLRSLWDIAMAYNEDWAENNPGDKPPFGDGIPIQAFPDAAPDCKVGKMIGDGEAPHTVDVTHRFLDQEGGWTDRLILTPEKGSWVISDIVFAPEYTSSLRQILVDTEITDFLDDREGCEHFRGEEPYDAERAAFLKKNIEELCPDIDKRLDDLQAKYWDNPVILQKLTGLERLEGP